MAGSTWRIRHQNIRAGRFRPSKSKQDDIHIDLSKDPFDNLKEVLININKLEIAETTLLNYLNVFVKLTLQIEGKFNEIGFKVEDVLCCLRIPLSHTSTQIRSGGLRCIRHVLKSENDVLILNKLMIPYLVTRSLDLIYKNDVERMEAMKLMRKTMILSPLNFDASMARSLVSLANEGSEGKDRMLRICLATLSELGILNSKLFISSGGVSAITRNLLECQTPKIAESLCGVLLLLLDKPETRNIASVDLHSVAAPFCDFHYKPGWKDKNRRDERDLRLNCSRLASLTILRSFSGILHFCSPRDVGGFRAIVDVLYLNQLEVRKAVLDLLYELLGLPQPEWTDELSVALSAIDPCEPQAQWRLNEGFIAAEGKSVLPHLACTTPSTTDLHLSLLLYCFLENGLLGALSEVIATSDTFISVRATVLLGELLRLMQVMLPPDCCNVSPSLPNLLEYAVGNKPQAMGALTALQQLHKLMKRRPASYSIYLDFILRGNASTQNSQLKGSNQLTKTPKSRQKLTENLKSKIHHLQNVVLKDFEDTVKETGVLNANDALIWNWSLINILLKKDKIDLSDTSHRYFLKRLVEFFIPSKNKYSHIDISSKDSMTFTLTAIELINYLIDSNDAECSSLLVDLFKDILHNIQAITKNKSNNVHDCLFSPQHMVNTQCQSYFLLIGRFSTKENGLAILKDIQMFDTILNLAITTKHDCYVKLIVSTLDYTVEISRNILKSVLKCNVEGSRLYATQFLLVLLRAGTVNFSEWGISFLVGQLEDVSKSVYLCAVNILLESTELPDCLDKLIEINPDLDKLQDYEKAILLKIRLWSTISGFNRLNRDNTAAKLIKKWEDFYFKRYVKLIEGELSDALTLHQRNVDGKYDKRTSSARLSSRRDLFLLPHLYGQLNQHREGFELLLKEGKTEVMIQCILEENCTTDEEILMLKGSIWSLAHMSTSNRGFEFINSRGLVDGLINIAQNSEVYSIKATAFYALGLVATTKIGADELFQKGWICTRHHRHDCWPIIKDELESFTKNQMKKIYTDLTSDESSIGNPFYFDENDSITETTTDDFNYDTDIFPKQNTLPTNKRQAPKFHMRSYSESKTFDVNEYAEERFRVVMARYRNNSVTDSTTSGISSSDSSTGACKTTGAVCEHTQTLSPIPSSSSLSTLQIPPGAPRQHRVSESSNRISSQSDTNSELSSFSNYMASHKLSYQDLIGYTTYRSLRRQTSDQEDFYPDASNKFVPNFSLNTNQVLLEDFKHMDICFKSVFCVQKFSLNYPKNKYCDKIYLGICLPQNLSSLFPSSTNILFTNIDLKSETKISISTTTEETNPWQNKSWQNIHNRQKCLVCCNTTKEVNLDEEHEKDTIELLRNIERLANPVCNKHVKQYLFQLRQRKTVLFKNLCIYSEMAYMISQNSYRLVSRRLLQEIFIDLDAKESMNVVNFSNYNKPVPRDRNSTSSIEQKTNLEELKFIYKENKFPIKPKT